MRLTSLAILLFIAFFASFAISESLPCQYTVNNPYQVEVVNLYSKETGELLIPKISVGEFTGDTSQNSFKIFNDSSFPVFLKVSFKFSSDDYWSTGVRYRDIITEVIIPARDYNVVAQKRDSYSNGIPDTSVKWVFLENEYYIVKYEKRSIDNFSCKKCPPNTDTNCLNDGQACSTNLECGGEYCIEGRCNNKPFCFENKCNCDSTKVQCEDNSKCVIKNTFELDQKPICSPLECKTGYVDEGTGLCAKSPAQLAEEEKTKLEKERIEKEKQIQEAQAQADANNILWTAIGIIVVIIFSAIIIIIIKKIVEGKKGILNAEEKAHKAKLAVIEMEMKNIKSKIKLNKENQEEAERKREKIAKEINEGQARLVNLKNQFKIVSSAKKAELKEIMGKESIKLDNLKNQGKSLENKINTLASEDESLSDLLKNKENRLRQLEIKIRDKSKEFEELSKQIKALKFKTIEQKQFYNKYINSPEWKEKSKKWKDEVNNSCELCGSKERLEAHHVKGYDENLGHETHLGPNRDVVVLCKNCHSKLHGYK